MAAPMVMSFLGRRVQNEGMSMAGLGNLLRQEAPAIRAVLPAGVTELLWPGDRETVSALPEAARSAAGARSNRGWLVPLVLLALVSGGLWLLSHGRRSAPTSSSQTGSANRTVSEIPRMNPRNVDLYFSTASMSLQPDSEAQLKEFAAVVAANPNAPVIVNGYTDNVGNAASNLRLSQQRANAVKDNLVAMGVPADRIAAQGFGEENPIADNSTEEGRRTNRRVTVEMGNQ
jgi:OOP family OmpA-OmpF porin